MCKWKKHGDTRIDPCMKNIVRFIELGTGYKVVMCCCGHNHYPPSIIIRYLENAPYDIFSGYIFDHNKKRFYKRDNEGIYYIPETLEKEKSK